MPVLLNNCRNRPYLEHYQPERGSGRGGGCEPFYDLYTEGEQADGARDLTPGRVCIVASYDGPYRARVRLDWFAFSHESTLCDNAGDACRVLFGTRTRSETLDKAAAAEHPVYGAFFNAAGHFKQRSVVAETA